jgi:type II secretory pathway pseudopilin PulG
MTELHRECHRTDSGGRDEAGVTLVEVIVATFVLGVGLMAAAQTVATGAASILISQEQLIAKQKAREALESVFTARNTQNVLWEDIRNVNDQGVFLEGFQDLRESGEDGIANTADDGDAPMETLLFPGPDGLFDTADDRTRSLETFDRSITISDVVDEDNAVDPDIRRIEVLIRYSYRGLTKTVRLESIISRFS